jgi:c-di-GMP-binding flagellar brake protein YcgR
MDGHTGLRTAFDMGAHFVLYKPVSAERAKASFRAARALMKRERRRNSRVAVQIPVALYNPVSGANQKVITTDFSEGGLAIQLPKGSKQTGPWNVTFTLPGSSGSFAVKGEAAWQNPGGQIGIRFTDISVDLSHNLRVWLNENSPESEKDDPPVGCKLTDLSLGGCYLELPSPFPVRTRIVLSMRTSELELRAEGVVRVMHPEIGMGVEFTQATEEQRHHVEKFIQHLMASDGALPELLVHPEGLDGRAIEPRPRSESEDPLLDLFESKASLPAEIFLGELRKQRRSHSDAAEENILPV